ncbi:hypothetical protein NL676_032946 [Syzygium grande]|nr:hypothetical protein NL676_032946 [Syzygium grande]
MAQWVDSLVGDDELKSAVEPPTSATATARMHTRLEDEVAGSSSDKEPNLELFVQREREKCGIDEAREWRTSGVRSSADAA